MVNVAFYGKSKIICHRDFLDGENLQQSHGHEARSTILEALAVVDREQ